MSHPPQLHADMPRKASLANDANDGLVFLAYCGMSQARAVTHPDTGLAYSFNRETPSWIPSDLANQLLKTEPRTFTLARPEPAYETLGGA